MLTPEDQTRIRKEEIFRAEVRERLAADAARGASRLWKFVNTSFGVWFLSAVVLGGLSWLLSERHLAIERHNAVRRATWEIYSDALQFEAAIASAWSRFAYETAFATKLQRPESRLYEQKTFGLDWLTFQVEDLGSCEEAKAAAAARDAAARIWAILERQFGKLDNDWWWTPLDADQKTRLDDAIKAESHRYLVEAFLPRTARRWCWPGG
jgi:hypothetical protein